jgi:hypothetical protein
MLLECYFPQIPPHQPILIPYLGERPHIFPSPLSNSHIPFRKLNEFEEGCTPVGPVGTVGTGSIGPVGPFVNAHRR